MKSLDGKHESDISIREARFLKGKRERQKNPDEIDENIYSLKSRL